MSDIPPRLASALADRYRIERELGAGGMATVYLADDLKHDRKVALKVLKPELAAVVGADRFLAEIKTTANLQHPHILPLFDSGEADGFLYYVMPYVQGESLRERLDREKHLHLHLVVLDGLFARETEAPLAFHRARGLDADAARALTPLVQDRVLRLFVRRRLLDPHEAADMRTWRGTGGFSLDGSVRVEAHDRAGLERLIRYCARPPFALHRLRAPAGQPALRRPDARLLYRLTRPLADGRTSLSLTPLELLQRLARLIPPPRAHRHRYHGVLAPNARLRPDVVRYGRPDDELRRLDDLHRAAQSSSGDGPDGTTRTPSPARMRWAQLLARVYELNPLRCPGCHGTLRILAFLTEPDVVEGILRHLGLPHRPPRLAPPARPPGTAQGHHPDPPIAADRNPSPHRCLPPILPTPTSTPFVSPIHEHTVERSSDYRSR